MKKLLLFSTTLFVLLTPLISLINFPLNDDWVYYLNVQMFLKGDFSLHPYLGPTFYTQGIIAAIFSLLFGFKNIPYLTLVLSVTNFCVFVHILRKLKIDNFLSVLLGLIYFFNPLNIYSSLGFMTEQYFMLFLLIALYLFLKYEETKKAVLLFLTFLVAFIALNQRQIALVIPLSLSIYYFWNFKTRFKEGLVSFLVFCLFQIYFSYLFPQTPRMKEVPLVLSNFGRTDYTISLIIGSLILLSSFLLPILINIKLKKIQIFFVLLIAVINFALIYYLFKPMEIGVGEYPYFKNIFQRTGFYPGGISGTKYYFKGWFDLFRYWDLISKIILSCYLAFIVFCRKKIVNFYSIFIVTYLAIMVTTQTFYDRYLLVLVPFVILFAVTLVPEYSKINKSLVIMFIAFLVFLNYQFAMDFLFANKYVWSSSTNLIETQGIAENKVEGTNAWKLLYRNLEKNYEYRYTYDSPKKNPEMVIGYEPIEEHLVNFPGSIWVDPKIYLYKKID